MSQMPPMPPMSPGSSMGVRPHRGVLILVFGILGLVACAPLGIVAWIMGNGDMRAIDNGEMDPEGRSLTQVGKILGIVATILFALGLLLGLFVFVLGIGAAAAGP
jgi:hypothetical protein